MTPTPTRINRPQTATIWVLDPLERPRSRTLTAELDGALRFTPRSEGDDADGDGTDGAEVPVSITVWQYGHCTREWPPTFKALRQLGQLMFMDLLEIGGWHVGHVSNVPAGKTILTKCHGNVVNFDEVGTGQFERFVPRRTSNIQHRTSDFEVFSLDVRCWMFDVQYFQICC
jgi:hypothetical protein